MRGYYIKKEFELKYLVQCLRNSLLICFLLVVFSFDMKMTRITFFPLLILIFDVFKKTSNFQNGILLWRYTVCLIIKSTKIKRKLYVSTRNLDDFILFFHRIWKWRWIITEIILISRYYSIKVVYIYINTVQPQCLYAKIPGKGRKPLSF